MKFLGFIVLTSAIALVGCEVSELRPIPMPASGGGWSAPARNPPRSQPSPFYPVLSVPDESVVAPNIKEATRKCQQRAEELSAEKGKTIVLINVRRSVISGAYVCQFQEL